MKILMKVAHDWELEPAGETSADFTGDYDPETRQIRVWRRGAERGGGKRCRFDDVRPGDFFSLTVIGDALKNLTEEGQ